MNNNVKRHNPQPKLVPQPYTNLLTERDSGKPPILEARHLGIDFGGLTAAPRSPA